MNRSAAIWLGVLAASGALALTALQVLFGELNQDEGWYLYAARLVSEGQWPYRDFAFTQAPLMPFVYALAHPLVEAFGVAGGRAFTALLGLASAVLAAMVARRLAAPSWFGAAGLAAFSLVALNVYQSYFTTVVKTYALCGCLLAAAAWAFAVPGRLPGWRAALCGLLFAGAAATRISSGFFLPVAGLALLAGRGRFGARAWLWFGAGGAAGLAMAFLPLFLAAPEAFRFFVIDYHAARDGGTLAAQAVFKAGFLSRLAQAYLPVIALGAGAFAVARAVPRPRVPRDAVRWALGLGLAGVSLVHLAAPFPYDDYQVPLYPLFAALVTAVWTRLLPDAPRWRTALAAGALAAALLAAFASPMLQGWMVIGRDRIWWRLRPQPALLQLREAGQAIRALASGSDELLTQDVYLAVETGLRVPRGLELGPFSYYPALSTEKARLLHVVNDPLLEDILAQTPARAAAMSGYSFVMAAPEVRKLDEAVQQRWWDLLAARFELVQTVPDFGQGPTALQLYQRRDGAP